MLSTQLELQNLAASGRRMEERVPLRGELMPQVEKTTKGHMAPGQWQDVVGEVRDGRVPERAGILAGGVAQVKYNVRDRVVRELAQLSLASQFDLPRTYDS